jgi:5'-3' exonuclease
MLLLIADWESMLYSVLLSKQAEGKSFEDLCKDTSSYIDNCIYETACTHYIGFTSTRSFRHELYPEYKLNRKATPKPHYYKELLKYITKKYKLIKKKNYEADDLCATAYRYCLKHKINYTVAHIDKDLNQFKGNHYRYGRNREHYFVSEFEAMRNFVSQFFLSQPADNIIVCDGLGEVTVNKLLNECKTKIDFIRLIIKVYRDGYKTFEGYGINWKKKVRLIYSLIYLVQDVKIDIKSKIIKTY